jgi:hypothetical protein
MYQINRASNVPEPGQLMAMRCRLYGSGNVSAAELMTQSTGLATGQAGESRLSDM